MLEHDVREVASVMASVGVWWAVAGGWATDLWLGRRTRAHHDIEVVVRRDDHSRVRDALRVDHELSCIDPPGSGWRPWLRTDDIEAPAFQLKARGANVEFDLFLETVVDDTWVFRRDARVRRPFEEIAIASSGSGPGVPVVRPEIQLLYMAKSDEPKNEHDFEVARPMLDEPSTRWLERSLVIVDPTHPWLERIRSAP